MAKKPRIDWYLPPNTGLASFDDTYPEGQGVGGAEATVVFMAREFAKRGYDIRVYGNPPAPMYGHGVRYEMAGMFHPTDDRDVFILHRTPAPGEIRARVNADVKVFFSCDQYTTGNWTSDVYPYVDKIFAISHYHKNYIWLYQNAKKENIYVTDLGVNMPDYTDEIPKVGGKMIFCSVPERGLEYALHLFKKVKEQVPHASLVVTSDHRLWGAPYTGVSDVLMAHAKGVDGVTYLGKIPREELVKHQLESEIMFYPCTYDENFCISAAECQAAGAVPVTTKIGAMSTTVRNGETGIVIDGNPAQPEYQEQFVASVIDLLGNDSKRAEFRKNAKARAAAEFDWSFLADKWLDQFATIKEEKNVPRK